MVILARKTLSNFYFSLKQKQRRSQDFEAQYANISRRIISLDMDQLRKRQGVNSRRKNRKKKKTGR